MTITEIPSRHHHYPPAIYPWIPILQIPRQKRGVPDKGGRFVRKADRGIRWENILLSVVLPCKGPGP